MIGGNARRPGLPALTDPGIPDEEPSLVPISGSSPRTRPSGGSLVLATGLLGETGGIQTYGRNLVEALRRVEARTSALVLNDAAGDLAPVLATGVEVRGFGRSRVAFTLGAIRQSTVGRPATVWLAHRNFLPLARFLRRPGSRANLIVYGIDAWPRLSRAERWALGSIDRVLAISPYTADCFRQAGFSGEIHLLPCSLSHDWAVPLATPSPWRAPYRLLSVSRLAAPSRRKGIDHTIEAVALLRRQGVPIIHDVVGEGPDEERLRTLAAGGGVVDAVRFRGRLDDARLRALYLQCDIFVLPSGAEGFGIVYLEALAHGRPVIASDAGGTPFLIQHGETGWLVRYDDVPSLARCIRERLADQPGSLRSAARGRDKVIEALSFPAFVRRVRSLVAAGHDPSPDRR